MTPTREQYEYYTACPPEEAERRARELWTDFVWQDTPQGHAFWHKTREHLFMIGEQFESEQQRGLA